MLAELEHCFSSCFLPALFGVEVSASERQLLAMLSRFGGLGVGNPVNNVKLCFESSVNSTTYLKNSILGNVVFELDAHITSVQAARQLQCKLRSEHNAATFTEVIGLFTPIQQRG